MKKSAANIPDKSQSSLPQTSQKFKKNERLRKSRDITNVLGKGKRLVGKGIILVFKQRDNGTATRAGFIVRKKMGKAVSRNLMKRRMRESYRRMKHLLKSGYDLTFSGQQIVEFSKVRDIMYELIVQANITNRSGKSVE